MQNRIREMRVALAISQQELAATIGCSQQALSSWEQNRVQPTLSAACDLADLFGVTLDDLAARDAFAPTPEVDRILRRLRVEIERLVAEASRG
jgi:DNA-binding XRE family transcriptional regulator